MSDPRNYFALGPCYFCGNTFEYDPDRVPIIVIDPQTDLPPDLTEHGVPVSDEYRVSAAFQAALERSQRKPICPTDVERLNKARVSRGEAPIRHL